VRSPRPHLAISAAGIGVGADGVADDVDSAGSSGVAGTPTFANGRRQYGAYDIDTLTAAVKTAKLSRSSTCRIVPVR
jgi:protein-disulfide isomerase